MTLLSGFGRSRLARHLSRIAGKLPETAPALPPRPPSTAFHTSQKLEAINSYAEFCDGGPDPAYPLEVFLELSNLCDLKCAMCVEFSALSPLRLNVLKARSRGFMEHDEVLPNMDEVLSHALQVHCFGYGEPTIHPNFREFLGHVSKFEVLIDFFSNGMHLDEDLCDFLASRRVYKITISFSGSTKAFYEHVYIGGDFERVLDGIQRLSEAKRRHSSPYPIIEINSLGFKDHVNTFDDFVQLMGGRGVNTIFLKPLQGYQHIPQLYEHISVMRPEIEGPILDRAHKIGKKLGVLVHTSLYADHMMEEDPAYRQLKIRQSAEQAFADARRPYGQNPISEFPAIAKELSKVKGAGQVRLAESVLSPGLGPDVTRLALDIGMPGSREGEPAFHCMEPFKTMYVTRNGAIKPCCFANPEARHLGATGSGAALAAWQGDGYRAVRDGAAKNLYSAPLCGSCINNRTGPHGHHAYMLIHEYAVWHERGFDTKFASSVASTVQQVRKTSPEQIVTRRASAQLNSADLQTAEPARVRVDPERDWTLTEAVHIDKESAPPEVLAMPGMTSATERQFLATLARDHYSGQGLILDVGGLLGASAGALAAGFRANPKADEIIARWRETTVLPIRTFERPRMPPGPGAAARLLAQLPEGHGLNEGSDLKAELSRRLRGYSDLVTPVFGDFITYQWGPEAAELCFIDLGRGQPGLFHLVRMTGAAFIPGKTILVIRDFYDQLGWRSNVEAGLLGDHLEWLGQIESCAIFRVAKTFPPELCGLDPLRTLPADTLVGLHASGDHPGLPLRRRVLLQLSKVNLLASRAGAPVASAYLQAIRPELEGLATEAKALALVLMLCQSAGNALTRQEAERLGSIAEPVA